MRCCFCGRYIANKLQIQRLMTPGMVHPCGSGAFGYFECTKDMSDLTSVTLFFIMSQSACSQYAGKQISFKPRDPRHQSSSASRPSHLAGSFQTLPEILVVLRLSSTLVKEIMTLSDSIGCVKQHVSFFDHHELNVM